MATTISYSQKLFILDFLQVFLTIFTRDNITNSQQVVTAY